MGSEARQQEAIKTPTPPRNTCWMRFWIQRHLGTSFHGDFSQLGGTFLFLLSLRFLSFDGAWV